MTGLEPVQVPFSHVSVCVQALPSLQVVPLGAAGLEHCPVDVLHVPATWHWSETVQVTGLEPTQVPLWQVSVCVQALPSVHAVPFVFGGLEHTPVVVLQVPTSWHWSEAVQTTGLLPVHTPLWQVSVWVQALPSLQALPLAFAGFEHVPVAGSQVPAVWHWSEAVQTTALPVHTPLWQVSVCVHALPSLQVLPLAFAGFEHVPVAGSQVPAVWHWSEAVQTTALPVHTPLWQVSVRVHALSSLQVLPLAFAGFEHVPVAGSQVPAAWHWWVAAQTTALPVHTPLCTAPVCVHALPSLQVLPLAFAGFEHVPVAGSHVPAAWHWSEAVQATGL